MSTLAFAVVLGILSLALACSYRTQRRQHLLGRVVIPVLLVSAGVASTIWTFSTRAEVSIGDRLQIVQRDPTLSAIPLGATLRGQGGDDCPDAYGGPYYKWDYSYDGPLNSVFKFYDERLRADGWKLLTPSTTSSVPSTSTPLRIPTTSSTTISLASLPRQGPSRA